MKECGEFWDPVCHHPINCEVRGYSSMNTQVLEYCVREVERVGWSHRYDELESFQSYLQSDSYARATLQGMGSVRTWTHWGGDCERRIEWGYLEVVESSQTTAISVCWCTWPVMFVILDLAHKNNVSRNVWSPRKVRPVCQRMWRFYALSQSTIHHPAPLFTKKHWKFFPFTKLFSRLWLLYGITTSFRSTAFFLDNTDIDFGLKSSTVGSLLKSSQTRAYSSWEESDAQYACIVFLWVFGQLYVLLACANTISQGKHLSYLTLQNTYLIILNCHPATVREI